MGLSSCLLSSRALGSAAAALGLCAFALPGPQFVEGTRIPLPPARPERLGAASDASDRMTVQVRVNGRGPFPFVIDTGADRTVVSRELAADLQLEPGAPVMLHGTGGVDLTPTARIDALGVGARELHGVSAPTLAGENLGAQGLLGVDSLQNQRMVMDFRHRAMTVEPSRRWDFGADVIVVRARSRYGQLVLVDASIGGRPLAVIVDSGAQNTIGNLALERQVLGPSALGLARPVDVISVSGRSTAARFAVLPRLRVGGVALTSVPIAFADLHTFAEFDMNGAPAMLLGMDVLRHFDRVTVDFGRRQVSFQLPDPS